MLPASPKIFHGREKELEQIVSTLLQDHVSRIAILGPGGIGKSALALAALHHPGIASKFASQSFFISCDSCDSISSLISRLATYFGLEHEQRKSSDIILKHISSLSGPSLIVFDNFETPWESRHTRAEIEDFLSSLSDFNQLYIMVCIPVALEVVLLLILLSWR